MKYIDTHGHLNSEEFINDLETFINKANEKGVEKIIIPGTNKEDSYQAIEISKKYKNTYAMVALHPTDGFNISDIDWLDDIDGSQLVGVGETGIDLYRETNPPLKVQEEIFRRHLRFALKWNLPVAIHTRDAEKETLAVLNEEEFKDIRFIIHCSTMNKEWVTKFVKRGGYISFSGIVTFKNALEIKEAMLSVPLNRLLTETDAPYLAPVPKRGKLNEPEYVIHTSNYVAELRPEANEEVIEQLWKNAHNIFDKLNK